MQKLIQIFSLVLATAFLTGCAGTRSTSHDSRIVTTPVPVKKNPLHEVSISPSATLDLAGIWPLEYNGNYLQKIKATAKGKKHSFSMHLNLDETTLEAVAYNDFVGRLYTLKWSENDVIWESSSYVPEIIKPENIIADFLLIHLPIEHLQNRLRSAIVSEELTETGKTRIIRNNDILRTISYREPLGNLWKNVVIDNPVYDYKLVIETVKGK